MTDEGERTYAWSELPEGYSFDHGPYIENYGEGPGIYFPRSLWTYQQARKEAAMYARDLDYGASRYLGKGNCRLDLEEGGPSVKDVPCWMFEGYER